MSNDAPSRPMVFRAPPPPADVLRAAIRAAYLADEARCIEGLLGEAAWQPEQRDRVQAAASELVHKVRARARESGGLDAFLAEYDLSSEEGIVLMCLAEALLRIPDGDTVDRLIQDRLPHADWQRHLGNGHSLFVNAATWGLMLTGGVVRLGSGPADDVGSFLGHLAARSGEPLVRAALRQAMRILGHHFVMGRSIEAALHRARAKDNRAYRYSFDMLGEAALTEADAERYFERYAEAIRAIGAQVSPDSATEAAPGISVKLSALHPRFELAQGERLRTELVARVAELAAAAREAGMALTIDAEEADRLEPTLDVFEVVFRRPELAGWDGLGLAVQAYQKRAVAVIDWLAALARETNRRIPLRLVKGAYWDTEIKRAQERGLADYPVFTRKRATDVSYLACARRVLAAGEAFYPQFATHNAYTVAAVMELAGEGGCEFQRLHGMGEGLYRDLVAAGYPCRVYAPVGSHDELLPYLVRRLLENGANTSFVNRLLDERAPIEDLVADPVAALREIEPKRHPRIPLPAALYGAARRNSQGLNLQDSAVLGELADAMREWAGPAWQAGPQVAGESVGGPGEEAVRSPSNHEDVVGHVRPAGDEELERALAAAHGAFAEWSRTPAEARAGLLEQAAESLERHRAELMALCVREAGHCIPDALAEVREAVDFCRYYAWRAREDFAAPTELPGPTGERNTLGLHGRGVFACISPWNFPLAIFTGQVAAALAAGNTVIAKPATQTPLIAARAVALLHEAGLPEKVLQLLPGGGATVGQRLVADRRVAGVAFTGSTETAARIHQTLAGRGGPIVPLIAETGGQNALIADTSALAEQLIPDVLASAFNRAGQRCSALRVLFLPAETADHLWGRLTGAMEELVVGDPGLFATDVGPVIDAAARDTLEAHCRRMERGALRAFRLPLPGATGAGTYVAPSVFEIDRLERLEREVFGPIVHVIRYPSGRLDEVIDAVNATGYGLTLGVHSRIEATAEYIRRRVRAGNVYVNRTIVGSVVGVQPFGGEGLSGTGPKAGGPRYLHRFATERTYTVNTAAVGGNAALLSLGDEAGDDA